MSAILRAESSEELTVCALFELISSLPLGCSIWGGAGARKTFIELRPALGKKGDEGRGAARCLCWTDEKGLGERTELSWEERGLLVRELSGPWGPFLALPRPERLSGLKPAEEG